MQHFQKVYAPFDGVITARNIDIGALINAGANAPGKELFDIAATQSPARLRQCAAAILARCAPGGAADLTQAEFPGRRFAGKIVRNADAIDPASRTLLTEVDVENPTGELLPGAFLSVHLKLRTPGEADYSGERADFPFGGNAGGGGARQQSGIADDHDRARFWDGSGSGLRNLSG